MMYEEVNKDAMVDIPLDGPLDGLPIDTEKLADAAEAVQNALQYPKGW
jgi:hypothetical protein